MAAPDIQLVIDTNVLIATINRKNFEYFIYQAFEAKKFTWIVSTEVLMEYAEELTEFYSAKTADYVLDILCTAINVKFAEPFYQWNLIKDDPDDNKFSDLALTTSAYGVITYDKHFDVFKKIKFPALNILKPKEISPFLK